MEGHANRILGVSQVAAGENPLPLEPTDISQGREYAGGEHKTRRRYTPTQYVAGIKPDHETKKRGCWSTIYLAVMGVTVMEPALAEFKIKYFTPINSQE